MALERNAGINGVCSVGVSSAVSEWCGLKYKKRGGRTKFYMIKRRLQYIEIKDVYIL